MESIERIRKLEAELAKEREKASTALLKQIEGSIAELNELGFKYSLTQEEGERPKKRERKSEGGRVCGTCGQKGHNSRTCPSKAA